MIIKSISAENFGKFDRYSVDLDETINVFYGDNEAGKTTLYEIISILLFAPLNDEEMAESNKLIKTDEKYARVYATINLEGKEISIAREIYVNDTNLSIADKDNVSSLGNVNVPFIGDLTKEMYESFHTIDYYNMATITNNVWQQIVKIIEESHGAPRKTPDFSSPEEDENVIQKSRFESEIKTKEKEKAELKVKLKESQKKQKRMIKNQDKIDDLLSEFEDVENNIELESSYLKEANKMNQIRSTIKRTQDLTLEIEKYKDLRPWMPNLRKYYERLKLYTENKANGIENPLDMFDDLEEKDIDVAKETDKQEKKAEAVVDNAENKEEETIEVKEVKEDKETKKADEIKVEEIIKAASEDEPVISERTQDKEDMDTDVTEKEREFDYSKVKLPSEEDYQLARKKINRFIEESYLNHEYNPNEDADDLLLEKNADLEETEEELTSDDNLDISDDLLEDEDDSEEELPEDVKPLEIRKPQDMKTANNSAEVRGAVNNFGQTNPYADNIYPNMDKINYSDKDLSKLEENNDDDDDKENRYSTSTSNGFPTQTKKVSEQDMNNNKNKEDKLLKAEEFLNKVNMQEIIAASKDEVKVDDEAKEEINKAQLRYKIIAKRVFNREMDMDDLSQKLRKLDTNSIYKSIVKYKELSQKQRKFEQSASKAGNKTSSVNGMSIALGVIAFISMLLGMFCFFIDQVLTFFPDVEALNFVAETFKGLSAPINNIVPGNFLAGGAFVLIAILLTIAIFLGNDKGNMISDQFVVNDVELDDLRNKIRMAKRQIIDALKDFPIPPSYLENPNNTIITIINELRDAESGYNDLIVQSKMPKSKDYRALWKIAKENLDANEISDDLFDNISALRRKIQDHKEALEENSKKLKEAKMRINMAAGAPSFDNNQTEDKSLGQFNSFGGASQSNKNTINSNASEFGLPQTQQNSFGTNDMNTQTTKSEDSSFTLPKSSTSSLNDTGSPESDSTSFGLPLQSQSNEFNAAKDTSMSAEVNTFGTTKDISYPAEGGTFGTTKDTSYPAEADTFGTIKDTSYPTGDNTIGNVSDVNTDSTNNDFGIPGVNKYTNDAPQQTEGANENPFGIPGVNKYTNDAPQQTEGANENPFGIPGVNRYTNDAPQQTEGASENPFGIPGVNKYSNDAPQQTEGASENPFGIPGVNRYTNDAPQQTEAVNENPFGIPGVNRYTDDASKQTEGASENPFGIPGVNKYTNDAPQQTEGASENPFGIPGVHKYTNDTTEQQTKNTEANLYDGIPEVNKYPNDMSLQPDANVSIAQNQQSVEPSASSFQSGLPGLDKFSNRTQQASNEIVQNNNQAEVPAVSPVVPPIATPTVVPTVAGAGAAGTVLSGGLPGLDKFSNRSEQLNNTEVEEAKATEQTEDDTLFGIPGIHKYSGVEQQTSDVPLDAEKKDEITSVEDDVSQPVILKNQDAVEKIEEIQPVVEEISDTADEEFKDTVEEVVEKVRVKDRREKEYDKLLEILGDDPESTIRDVEEITRELHREITKRDNDMANLLKLNDAAVRLSTLSSNKWPYKEKAVEASKERIDYLEADKLKLMKHLKMLEGKYEDVEYEDTPQAISDRLKAVKGEIEQLKLENDKHALAAELMEKQRLLDMSSSADRSHIIDDTSVYMKELTLGKYIKVKINHEQTGLSICDKDGIWFDTTKDRLSQATREQLYLALRISIADLFDEKSLIFPMFFDEALITWDKRRMKAVMRLLSKMSMHRQVIIFTCHDWLKDMISNYLISAKIILM